MLVSEVWSIPFLQLPTTSFVSLNGIGKDHVVGAVVGVVVAVFVGGGVRLSTHPRKIFFFV